jgi:type II secretory pathway pseudopilin PulG
MNLGLWVAIGVVVLGAALAFGLLRNSRRDRRMDAATEDATREVYQNYEAARRAPDSAPDVLKR